MAFDAFVLAAGLGTRLRPLTLHRPKPLLPVCGLPLMDYTLALCRQHGLHSVVMNAHHLAGQIERWAGDHDGVHVDVRVEHELLGTGGGLRAVIAELADRFVVVNGDVLTDMDLGGLRDAVREDGAAMGLRRHPDDAWRYGVVATDELGVICRLVDVASAPPVGRVNRDTHFTGLHAMDRSALELVPADGLQCVVRTAYKVLVPRRKVQGVVHPGIWLDIGDPAAYLAANMLVLTTDVALPWDPMPHATFATGPRGTAGNAPAHVSVEGSAWIGGDASLGKGTVLADSIVGANARVDAGTSLTRCVVWDGVHVPPGAWSDTVFHDGGALKVTP